MMDIETHMQFSAVVKLSEPEIRLLHIISQYNTEDVYRALASVIGTDKCLNKEVLRSLLSRWSQETGACIHKFNSARKVFEKE